MICGTFYIFADSAADELKVCRVQLLSLLDTDVDDSTIMWPTDLLEINQLNNKISVTFFVSHCVLRKGYCELVNSHVSLDDCVATSAMIHLYRADFNE